MEPIDIKSRCYKVGIEFSSDQESLFNQLLHHFQRQFSLLLQQSLLSSSDPRNGTEPYNKILQKAPVVQCDVAVDAIKKLLKLPLYKQTIACANTKLFAYKSFNAIKISNDKLCCF